MDKNLESNKVVTFGLTNILNENHTELNFFEVPFTNLYAQRNIFLTSALLVPVLKKTK